MGEGAMAAAVMVGAAMVAEVLWVPQPGPKYQVMPGTRTQPKERTANLPNSNFSGVTVGARPGAGDRGPALTSSDLPSLR
eukprot:scaffold10231_cov81-Isochrysis_galbana.AAC.6